MNDSGHELGARETEDELTSRAVMDDEALAEVAFPTSVPQ